MSGRPTLKTALVRGLRLSCPSCGKGRVFRAYLKPVEVCSHCHEPLGHIRADDGPAWLTILVVGHVIGPGLVLTQMRGVFSPLQGAAFWLPTALIMVLALMPSAKGIFIALLWQTRAPGSELDGPDASQNPGSS